MSTVFILLEQALGYCLLKVKHCKSADQLVVMLQDKNFDGVKEKIKLVEFQPFSSVNNASLNCQDIANGIASEDLISLLKKHVAEGPSVLVVSDRKLLESLKAANINKELEFNGDSAMVLHLRRVRHCIHEFIGDSQDHLLRAHIGLGHSFSRMKIKFNVNRADNMIIQSINLLDQLDKDINTMSMRLREWFGYHYPELVKIVNDNRAYSEVVKIIGSRAGALDTELERLETVVGDTEKAKQIIITARTSMGYELTEEDLLQIGQLATKALSMMQQREDTAKYLSSKMSQVAPNFSTLVGDIVAARLISHAGSLINLAKFPASTIQILGAEKALFRALKTRTNTPKYGLIFHSSFIGRAAKHDKGRISRFLAAKISLAVRLDCFMDEPMNIYGLHLKKQVEDQLKYLETGEEPMKNYEAMELANVEACKYVADLKVRSAAAAEAKKKEIVADVKVEVATVIETKESKKKRKSKKVEEMVVEEVAEVKAVEGESKKKRKSKVKTEVEEVKVEEVKVEAIAEAMEVDVTEGEKKKKRKSKKNENAVIEEVVEVKDEVVEVKSEVEGKKKKRKSAAVTESSEVVPEENGETKKKRNSKVDVVEGVDSKKHKKEKKSKA